MEADRTNPVSVTMTTMRDGQLFVVALCRTCRIVRERFLANGDASSVHLIASDALAKAGCMHASALAPPSSQRLPSATDLPVARIEPLRPTRREIPRVREPLPSVTEEIGPANRDPRSE